MLCTVTITTGDGELSYYVSYGTDVIDIDRDTGAITVKGVESATVVIEASETEEYRRTTKNIRVTIEETSAPSSDDGGEVNVREDKQNGNFAAGGLDNSAS